MRRNAAKLLRPTRQQVRPARTKSRPAPQARPDTAEKPASVLTLGDLIAAAYDVVGDNPQKVADVLSTTELRRRIRRQIFFV